VLPADGDDAMFDALSTERPRPELADLDLWPTLDCVEAFAADGLAAAAAMRDASRSIAAAADAIASRLSLGGRLIYVGAGTGGRMAAIDAAEIGPSYGLHGTVIAVLAGGLAGFAESREHHEDIASEGAAGVGALGPTADDVVFGVSASGRTPYVLGGIGAGRAAGSLTVGFACTMESDLARQSDLAIEVTTGPEIIAGSTRLKAGTAQKLVLNTISTLVMVRLGRTYGNLMVDVVADNAKLRRRATRVVVQATAVDDALAAATLAEAGGSAKVAVVALRAGVSVTRAEELLAATGGNARVAIGLADARD
jgi:N-acetylmuramic acid 6-phosphate etherase